MMRVLPGWAFDVDTLKGIHGRLPSGLQRAIPPRLEGWLRRRFLAPPGRVVPRLEARLWRGFSRSALAELEARARDPASGPGVAAEAALALARWHGVQGDFAAALAAIELMIARNPDRARRRTQLLLQALFLCRLGRGGEARALLEDCAGLGGFDVSLALMRANTWNREGGAADADEDRVLAEINAVYVHFGLPGIAKRESGRPLGLDNLRVERAPPPHSGPRVTVIVPVWNAAATLGTALASLAEQSHDNLEILVVDDLSEDASADVAADVARADRRFRLIRACANGGSYAARNRALAEATGAFVTCQDADDWSHPARIALHLDDLRGQDVPFNISDWVRATPGLFFPGGWRPTPDQPHRNFSSVFVSRDLVDRIGPWDTARVSADREFVNRIQRLFGLKRQYAFLPGCPLAFGRSAAGSLTRLGPTHVATQYHGIRREYHEATDFWHARLDPEAVLAEGLGAAPPYFPAPVAIRSERRRDPEHDLLLVGDFNFRGGTQKSALNMLAAAQAAGLDASLLHYRRYDQDVTKPLSPDVRQLAWESGVRIVAPGEAVRARTVVVTYPPIFDHAMDRFPAVDHDRLVVVVNQMAERDRAGTDRAYDPLRVRAHLREALGSEGLWAPISARVRALMLADGRYPVPIADTWTPLVDTGLWCARPQRWRGGERARPVLGRHGRDHPLKWPAERESLRAAYCAGRPCAVRFLGGARHARARLRRWPRNWHEEPFGARDVRDFLAELDVFLHFPDRDYIEEFGRAPMEAMASGIPVLLPPEFEPTFGGAALYVEPEAVWPLVEALWRDEAAWTAQAERGRAFVRANCGYEVFPGRLARLGTAPPQPAFAGGR